MILVRPQFVSLDSCEKIVAAFRTVESASNSDSDQFRKKPYSNEIVARCFVKTGLLEATECVGRVRQEAMDAVRQFYEIEKACYIEFTLLTEIHPGGHVELHADNEMETNDGDWVPNHTAWRDYAAILYLNTSGVDYEGGIVRFPAIGQEIVPEAALLIGFKCGRMYQHEVTAIERGFRYALLIWITHDPDYAEDWG